MARRVLISDISGGRVQGRPMLAWIDGVKVALCSRGMTVEAETMCERLEGVESHRAYIDD